MKATSATMPAAPYEITYYGETCEVRLLENAIETEPTEEEPAKWDYDEYKLTVRNRTGLIDDIESNLEAWITAAKSAEYEKLAAGARSKRDELLAECDWTQTTDTPLDDSDKTAWAAYRQLLRDVPQQAEFPQTIMWPEKP